MHGRAALLVPLALAPCFGAARACGSGQTRLDRSFRVQTHSVPRAAAVLQCWTILRQVELYQRRDAVTRTLSPLPVQHRAASARVMLVGVVTVRLSLAVHNGLPTDEPAATTRREQK